MNELTAFALPATTRAAVLRMMVATGDQRSPAQVLDAAVKAWLREAGRADPRAAIEVARGFQWKSLFLSDGTLLRAEYMGEYYEAQVEGDHIVFRGQRCSPRQMLMQITGSVRNAWRELWIHEPGDARWHLANTRRHILRREPGLPATPPVASLDAQGAPLSPKEMVLARNRAHARQWQSRAKRHILHRGDIVRDDQPDLSVRAPNGRGHGPGSAGRAGPADRRLSPLPPDYWAPLDHLKGVVLAPPVWP